MIVKNNNKVKKNTYIAPSNAIYPITNPADINPTYVIDTTPLKRGINSTYLVNTTPVDQSYTGSFAFFR